MQGQPERVVAVAILRGDLFSGLIPDERMEQANSTHPTRDASSSSTMHSGHEARTFALIKAYYIILAVAP
ncbi:MAG: hypothetical protein Q8S73_20690 [Deltaproteobacteria bacterium]|nr:hypothetical protein [Deltaproteobacteria bacterium]